jgi:hypothetical protein
VFQSEERCVTTSILEIVDCGDGEIVLQHSDDDSEPVVSIRFSDEARMYLMGNGLEVARAMIQAGIQAAAEILEQEEGGSTAREESERVLH